MKKKGEILIENVVFIILNFVFFTILVLFLVRQGSNASFLEDSTSKQIALLIDSAKPGMLMKVNLEKLMKVSEKNEFPFENVIRLENNKVFVKLSEKGGKDYHFFNDVFAAAYPELNSQGEYSGMYIITISENEE